MNFLFQRLQKQPSKWLWIFTAFFIKFVFVAYTYWQGHSAPAYANRFINFFVYKASDYNYFIGSAERYFEYGYMSFLGEGHPFGGRMPGYGFPYILLRFFMSNQQALTCMILAQIIFAAIAIYLLAKACMMMTKSMIVFYSVFFVFAFLNATTGFDIQTMTESYAVSCCCAFLYFFVSFTIHPNQKKHLLIAGFFLMWMIFLRPFMGVLVMILPVYFLFSDGGMVHHLKKKIVLIGIVLSPFMVAETAWVMRNFAVLGKFVPLETKLHESYGKVYSKGWIACRNLFKAYGEGAMYFEKGTLAYWFRAKDATNEPKYYQFSSNIFEGLQQNQDSLLILKNAYREYKSTDQVQLEDSLDAFVERTANRYTAEYVSKHPLKVYFLNPIKRFKKYLLTSGSSYLLFDMGKGMKLHHLAVRLLALLSYYLILGMFFFSMIVLIWKKMKDGFAYALLITCLFNILFISLIAGMQENRYVLPIIPIMILFSSVVMSNMYLQKDKIIERNP
jgi:hypothetical protein